MIHFYDSSVKAPPDSWLVVWTESRAEKKVEGRLVDEFVRRLRAAIERKDTAPEAVAGPAEYQPGEEVLVQEGPLAGLRGVVRESRNGARLVIWVAEVGRGMAFTIGSALVRAAR